MKQYSHYKEIPGWGVDADPQNNPTYPMKHYTGDDHRRLDWIRPPLQKPKVEILQSVERPYLPAVFGTTLPPKGLSGYLRRYAYGFTESEYGRWLNLLLADRIAVAEGVLDDLRRGYIPNIFKERGMVADWHFNRKELVRNIVAAGLLAAAGIWLLSKKKRVKSFK